MALAVCLLFDTRGDQLVRELWARLEASGIRTLQSHTHGHHHPHLSLAVLLDWDLDQVRVTLGTLPDGGPVELSVQGTLAFPRGRGALALSAPASVVARQEAVSRALMSDGALVHHHYQPGMWVPHVSLATRATGALLPTVVKAVADVLPLTLHADRAALIDSSTGELWPLASLP
ncbi:2'-5' RNA ligase [Nocardioides gansuensis]|uniref:2'-5' RNA ligase n=1 Tax=Nocardioides gansuensis TaxID=2138300 RepID=A0A2T8F7C6_9ACTN|nr:2'-5' RNA ligase family protein [Nocardioides gansuensis]PVG81599.1 2'-5' RNA ligase [Nocardioides gansuensis]